MASLNGLSSVLVGGLADGRWCIFHDSNNQAGFFGALDQAAVNYLAAIRSTQVPLRTNCRNTSVILEKVQTSLGADMGTRGAGFGPIIREQCSASNEESAKLLAIELVELIDKGGLSPSAVTILSPYPFHDSCVWLLPEKIRREIRVLDEFSLRNFPSA